MDDYPKTYTSTIWTYADYCELPSDGKQYQVMGGVLYMVPSPNYEHQRVLRKIFLPIANYAEKEKLGEAIFAPFDVVFTQTDVVQPDILFVSKERSGIIEKQGVLGAPDLIVEAISPSTKKVDEEIKKDLFEKHGVCEYILVYPEEKKIVHYYLQSGKYELLGTFHHQETLSLKTLPLSIPLSTIF